jgi:1-acyl-sn-glycerol-3-phosphate acyltransferase
MRVTKPVIGKFYKFEPIRKHVMAENTSTYVDIKDVFSRKNPGLARLLPGFVYRYLKRIIHEDYINWFLDKHGHKYGVDFARAGIEEFNVTLTIEGSEHIPKEGRFIFASNHPLGGFDGLILLSEVNKHFEQVKFLVNDILMNIENLQPVFLPINKHGKQGIEAARKIEAAYASDIQILTFPAGLVSRKVKGRIIDLEWKKNFIVKAKKHKRDVIPVHVSGRNTNFFYRLANLRKFLGIKSNIEMLYLVDETYKHRNKHITVKFGKPIPYSHFDRSKSPSEWAYFVKQKTYELNNEKI